MNKERITQLADHLDTLTEDEFDMGQFERGRRYDHDLSDFACYTPSCIAGYAAHMFAPDRKDEQGHIRSCSLVAKEVLDLDGAHSRQLFLPSPEDFSVARYDEHVYGATPQQAAQVLRILRDTGEVSWEQVMGPMENEANA